MPGNSKRSRLPSTLVNLDLGKAFESVWVDGLLLNLFGHNCSGCQIMYGIIESFFKNQRVFHRTFEAPDQHWRSRGKCFHQCASSSFQTTLSVPKNRNSNLMMNSNNLSWLRLANVVNWWKLKKIFSICEENHFDPPCLMVIDGDSFQVEQRG